MYGKLYLSPGNPYTSATNCKVHLGDPTYTGVSMTLEAIGVETNIDLYIYAKGASGDVRLNSASLGNVYAYGTLIVPGGDITLGETGVSGDITGGGSSGTGVPINIIGGNGATNFDGGVISLKGGFGSGSGDGGDIYIHGGSGTVDGQIYFGTGAAGNLIEDAAETNFVAYDTATGLLTYRSVDSVHTELDRMMVKKFTIDHTIEGTQTALVILPANSIIWHIDVYVSELFDDSGTDELDIGRIGAGELYCGNIDLSSTGWKSPTVSNVPNSQYTAPRYTYHGQNNDASQGEADIYIHYSTDA